MFLCYHNNDDHDTDSAAFIIFHRHIISSIVPVHHLQFVPIQCLLFVKLLLTFTQVCLGLRREERDLLHKNDGYGTMYLRIHLST